MNVENLPIASLTMHKNNAKLHPQEQIEQIKESIRLYGFNDPIGIWGKKNTIVEGHGRYMAAKEMGMQEVPCIRLDHLTDKQRREYMLVHNQTTMNSGWDFDLLSDELDGLDFDGFDFGFDLDTDAGDEPGEVVEDDYDAEPPVEPKAKLGDIYQLGRHRLMCGDSTKAEGVERLMDGQKADMVFTDPPYNVAIGSKNKVLNENNHKKRGHRIEEDIENDKGMTDEEIGESIWKPVFINLRDSSKDCCSIYVTMPQGGSHMMMMMMMMSAAWQVKHELIWVKNQPTFSMGRLDYDYQHEPICYGWNKSHKFYGNGKYNKSIWNIDKPKESKLHPTMKPIELIVNAVLNSTQEGDLVIDFFGGSGSTLIACEQTNRNCYMMELDPRYIDVIIDRWEKFTGEKAVKLN